MTCFEKRIVRQFRGIFYLQLRSYSSRAKTWLSIRNRISPWLKVFHMTLYLCSECSFVSFLNRLTANDRGSEPRFGRLHTYLHTSSRIFENILQNGPEYSYRNLAIARFPVTAMRKNIGGLLSWLVSLSNSVPELTRYGLGRGLHVNP